MKLYMLIGLPASGKSTYALKLLELCKKLNEEAIIISSDEIRKEILGDVNDQTQNSLVFEEVEKRVLENLKEHNVIYDATNINYKRRMNFLKKVGNYCAKIAILMATPYETCIERNNQRERKVPIEAIKRMYHNFYVPQHYEGFDDINVVYDKYDEDNEIKLLKMFVELDGISQDNPNHTLTIGEHCEKAKRYFSIHDYCDTTLETAALLHDIGKKETKTFINSKGEKTDIAHYYNHEKVGAYKSLFYTRDLPLRQRLEVAKLIQWHMLLNNNMTQKTVEKYKKMLGRRTWGDLETLHQADIEAK